MLLKAKLNDPRFWIFVVAFGCAGAFALYTQHAWEDYYITYRASKNLATGHGLVFNVGDRLHTFTSPLGVLLPAVASALTFNSSDAAALWIFRVMSCFAFAGAATFLFATSRKLGASVMVGALAAGWLCTDSKSVDFSINGMETGFMLLFLAYMVWALFAAPAQRRWLQLGVAWGGLMWTRPDSFIYIGLVGGAAWLFNSSAREGFTRRDWLTCFLKAGLVCTAIYLPWFIGAWLYYGSPVPHTIIAKASAAPVPWTATSLLHTLVRMPELAWTGKSTIEAAFLPTYFSAGGWPNALVLAARGFGIATACLWLLPKVKREVRVMSAAFLGAHIYLTYFPYYPFPWYLPPTTFLAIFAWAALLGQASHLTEGSPPRFRYGSASVIAIAVCLLAAQLWMFQGAARQMQALQSKIDSGNRQHIGEWLAEHAAPGDRVFLEPLGYIGYFSRLKTYDWPGLSSREVVEAHKLLGGEWGTLISYLGPDWVVLRPVEIQRVTQDWPTLLSAIYEKVRDFDVSAEVAHLNVPGRRLLEMDAAFSVYHRRWPKKFVTDFGVLESKFAGPPTSVTIGNLPMRLVHAPGSLTVKVPSGARHVRVSYGLNPAAYETEPKTDGASFDVVWKDGDREQILHHRELDPNARASDRGAITFDGELPTTPGTGASLVLRTLPGQTSTKDWTCWTMPDFR